jgi:hypothetical protein
MCRTPVHPSHPILALTAALALACSDHDPATEGESGTSDAPARTWEPETPGANCPEAYDPNRLYALLERSSCRSRSCPATIRRTTRNP